MKTEIKITVEGKQNTLKIKKKLFKNKVMNE